MKKQQILLYSTGNNTQYYVINHNGKENNVCVYIYITESLFCTAEINIINQLYLNKII